PRFRPPLGGLGSISPFRFAFFDDDAMTAASVLISLRSTRASLDPEP
ncbi:MAG: hypothetical protein HRU13_10580, partial [Phycisphaerales bacterium]|nr:hypothetical protein [Phycisphaerales bacterium]